MSDPEVLFSTRKRKRPIAIKQASQSSSDSEDDLLAKPAKTAAVLLPLPTVQSTSSQDKSELKIADSLQNQVIPIHDKVGEKQLTQKDDFATATRDTESQEAPGSLVTAQTEHDQTYRGKKNYRQYIEKKDTIHGSVASNKGRAGPTRVSAHIRVTARFDYQADVCKDYKETGYCGYGDNCKFLHDRGDYLRGWELDKQWDEQQKANANKTVAPAVDLNQYLIRQEEKNKSSKTNSVDQDLPFACHICRGPFKQPVMTKCQHYFCESCAIQRNKRNPTCAVCGQVTSGQFQFAHRLVQVLQEREQKAEAIRRATEEALLQ